MRNDTLVALALIALAATACAMGAAKSTASSPQMTCQEFLGVGEREKPLAVTWLDGYSKGGRLREEDVGEIDVDRQMTALIVACEQVPKQTLWDRIRADLPGGRKVQPAKLTCQDFVAMTEPERREVVYWADGYDRAAHRKEGVFRAVELDRAAAVILVECQQAPRESLWARIKQHL
jgi:HdeA/HdeB family